MGHMEGPMGLGDVASPPNPLPAHTPLCQPSCSPGAPTHSPLGPNKTPSSATTFLPPSSRFFPPFPPPSPIPTSSMASILRTFWG